MVSTLSAPQLVHEPFAFWEATAFETARAVSAGVAISSCRYAIRRKQSPSGPVEGGGFQKRRGCRALRRAADDVRRVEASRAQAHDGRRKRRIRGVLPLHGVHGRIEMRLLRFASCAKLLP